MSSSDSSSERIIELETQVMHLQSDVAALNTVVLQQQADINALKSSLGKLDERLSIAVEVEEARDPSDERPPHY